MAYPPNTLSTDKTDVTGINGDHPSHHNALATAINDVVTELGTDPSGTFTNVTLRLTAFDIRTRLRALLLVP